MHVSRFAFTLTLISLTVAQAAIARAQTTPPSSTPSTPSSTTTLPSTTTAGVAQQSATTDPEARIRLLEDRLAALEKSEAKAVAAAAVAPAVTATRDGLNVRSADNAFAFRLRGYVQSDARFFGAKGPVAPGASTFLLRRVRPIFEATAYKYFGLRLMPDFGNGQVVLYDAYAEAKPNPSLNLRVGKFKPPIGLERLQSATDVRFVERGLPTSLVPNRDVGVQLYGELAKARVQYQVGAFDGAPDAATLDGDQSTGKDVAGRLFFRPFASDAALPDLGFGVAGSSGTEQGTLTATGLPSYKTTGQLNLFRYRADGTAANTVIAEGRRTRVSPQGYLYAGPVGVLAEYVRSTQNVRRATTTGTLTGARTAATCRVLLVDDNRDVVTSTKRWLHQLGHDVRVALDGADAMVIAAEFHPDVVLLDIAMPKMNGYEVARTIRSSSWGRDMTLVAVTGWGQPEDQQRSMDAGFDRHMTKPVDPDDLEAYLDSVARG